MVKFLKFLNVLKEVIWRWLKIQPEDKPVRLEPTDSSPTIDRWELIGSDLDVASDTKIDPSNAYRHYKTSCRADHVDLQSLLIKIDKLYFDSWFESTNEMPGVAWWWRGAKKSASSTTGGVAAVAQNVILINFRLSKVSDEAMGLLLFHELLHIALYRAGLSHGHTHFFYRLEEKYRGFGKHNKELESAMRGIVGDCIAGRRPPRKLRDLNHSTNCCFGDSPSLINILTSLRYR